ncbi:MAG TPA: hypothetical protein DEP35_15480 [Deltaproteobacteria bacterium]|nr:hypothetical protein [Deltaproteobacteria bacterium]
MFQFEIGATSQIFWTGASVEERRRHVDPEPARRWVWARAESLSRVRHECRRVSDLLPCPSLE